MTKSAEAFRTISEVADWLDTPTHVLRFWESKFSQIKPVKRAGGRRYYRPQDMLLIGGIKELLHSEGTSIKGTQKILRELGQKYVCSLSKPLSGATNSPDTQQHEKPVVESDLSVTEAEFKPMVLTAIATDLGEDGKLIEPNPAERDLPDLAIEQLDSWGKSSVEQNVGSETFNIIETSNASVPSNHAAAKDVSDMDQDVIHDFAAPTTDIPPMSYVKPKRASKKEMKKSLDLFDDDQPMLNFWASDDEALEAESIDKTEKAIDRQTAFSAAEDFTTLNEVANSTETVPVLDMPETDNRITDHAKAQKVVLETGAINASGQDEVFSASADSVELTRFDATVSMDAAEVNVDSTDDCTAQTNVAATLRSIEDHLDGQPIVGPVRAKALRSCLIALKDAISKR